jgi:hypothetical protein
LVYGHQLECTPITAAFAYKLVEVQEEYSNYFSLRIKITVNSMTPFAHLFSTNSIYLVILE